MSPLILADDPRAAPFRDLKGRARDPGRDPGRFVVEGEHATLRLLASPFGVDAVLCEPPRVARLEQALAGRPGTPLLVAEPGVLLEITGVELHRGCVALARRPERGDEAALDRPATGARSVTLVVEGLADPANLGAVIRSARALGAALVVVDARGADPFSPRAVRAAMGHVFDQPLLVHDDLPAAVARLQAGGRRVLAARLAPDATPLEALDRPRHAVLLLGNEGHGLSERLAAAADESVVIPIAPGVDSLNVGAAAAILLHALR